MEILGFLLGLGCLVVIVWAIALVTGVVFGRQQNRPPEQPSPKPTEFRKHRTSQAPTIVPSVLLSIKVF